ncbi:hypothetical protein PHLCEN_2v1176 [Hermanssonia centrifuga]|uniref:PIG-P domain-containing protein n=1 Tax=Hermanssonia centrifuga TaxID=98765 RepID=A0A2R6S3U4_9APHY|nr:hypothetical protein PHLCEN_2v1176 [Hermanssonia centrifuga]
MEENDSPTSPVSPLAPYPPLPPTDVRSRAPEFYGFVAWISTYLLFIFFLLWAILPDEYINSIGISWYPSRSVLDGLAHVLRMLLTCAVLGREWAVLLPAYSVVVVLLTYFTYFSLALAGTPRFSDISTITGSPSLPSLPENVS